jgi:hypothetical protein
VASREVPPEIEAFLQAHIRSVMQLEVLLLLHREADRWWTASGANLELRSSLDATYKHLRDLCDSKLVEIRPGAEPQFRFAPAKPEDLVLVASLAELFRTRFYSVVESVYTSERKGIRAFADAFKLKKGGPDNG